MLTKQQLNILGVFYRNMFAELTFRQIKKQAEQKSNNIIQIALKEFLKQGLIRSKAISDVFTYQLNLSNNSVAAYLNVINQGEIQKRKFPKEILAQIQEKILKKTEFFILIVFGSYAKGKATQKSDLDVAVIVESEKARKEIAPFLETIKRRETRQIDHHIFTRKEFLELLDVDYENIGKQIFKNSIIYYGYIPYFNMIRGTKNE